MPFMRFPDWRAAGYHAPSALVTLCLLLLPAAVVASPNSANAYVASPDSSALAIFDKGPFVAAPPPPAAPVDLRPVLSRLRVAPASFRALAAGASIVGRHGTRVSYTLSEPAIVTFTVQRVVAGRRAGGRCVPVTRATRRAKRCDRLKAMPGSFVGLARPAATRCGSAAVCVGARWSPGATGCAPLSRAPAGNTAGHGRGCAVRV